MADLEILHLSDLHWESSKSNDARIVVDALIDDLARSKAKDLIAPDLLVFSGDLVNAGEEEAEFDSAFNALLAPSLDALGLDFENLLVVPGNHDISRKAVRDAKFLDNGLRDTLRSVDVLNKFIDDLNSGNNTNMLALSRLNSYYNFVDETLVDPIFKSPLLRVFKRNLRGLSVGAACFDTAWRSTGEADDVDRAHLLLGERNVDNAVAALTGNDLNLAIMHHPLDWLADFDEVAVSSRISANFDVLFCGHMHRPIPQTRTTAQGTAVLSQTGSVYAGRRWFNGYQTVQLMLADAECTFEVRSYYDTPRREFDEATNVMPTGRVSFPFAAQKKTPDHAVVEAFLRDNRQRVRENAAEHLNMTGLDLVSTADVKETFVPPPLTMRPKDQEDEGDNADKSDEQITAEDLLRSTDSYVLAGHREVGKTSLLHYLAVLCAEGVADRPRIPVILNVETLKTGEYELRKAVSTYFGSLPKSFDVNTAIASGMFLFLADNYAEGHKGADALTAQIAATPSSRWICAGKPRATSLTGEVEDPSQGKGMKRVRLGSLPRRSIRALSKRWSPIIGSSDEDVFKAVMKQLKADGLPRTGYMVTLILWAMMQEKELDRVNEAILLGNVADHLLDKANFTQSIHGHLDPRGKEITLEYLAEYLHSVGGYSPIDTVNEYLAALFKSKRLPLVAMDVFSELVKCGILDRSEGTARFKYKCFQEYFLALRIRGDRKLFADVLKPDEYRRYAREIEMLAGLQRQNTDIIEALQADMARRMPEKLENVARAEMSEVVDSSLGFEVSRRQIAELRKKRLTAEQVDEILDAADRRAIGQAKTGVEGQNNEPQGGSSEESVKGQLVLIAETPDRMNLSEYMSAVSLLAKVTKNSDFTDFSDKAPAARIVLESYAKFCVLFRREIGGILTDFGHDVPGTALDENEHRVLVYHITKLVAGIVASVVADMLSAPNIGPMMDEILAEDDRSTIERLFIIYLLQGLRFHGWEKRWSDLLRDTGQSGFVIESIISRMRGIVNSQYLDNSEYDKFHKVIDAAEEVLGWSNAEKNHMIADLRKAALQADLRDTA